MCYMPVNNIGNQFGLGINIDDGLEKLPHRFRLEINV